MTAMVPAGKRPWLPSRSRYVTRCHLHRIFRFCLVAACATFASMSGNSSCQSEPAAGIDFVPSPGKCRLPDRSLLGSSQISGNLDLQAPENLQQLMQGSISANAAGTASAAAFVCFTVLMAAVPKEAAAVTATAVGPGAGLDFAGIWSKAAGSAFKGGTAGLLAGVAQVLGFMWLRTSMNYQYFNGGGLQNALATLWNEGGLGRLYQGLSMALIQAPLSRFGDTAANAGVLVLMDYYLPDAPITIKTAAASVAAASWRVFLTPIDTLKTTQQVQGNQATQVLLDRVRQRGLGELYAGAVANFVANWVGNYPYFLVFNSLSEAWSPPADDALRIVRNGVLGICSSVASDLVSNSLRVLKTVRQSSPDANIGYIEAAKSIVERDGITGLLGRGLETRLLVNILQGTFFTILWKLIEEKLNS